MTGTKTGSDFGEALLSGLEEIAEDGVSVSDEECAALLKFAKGAAATVRRSRLDVARGARERSRSLRQVDLSGFSLSGLRKRVETLLLSNSGFAVQHRDLEDMAREDLESLIADLEALGGSGTGNDD